MIDLKKMTFGCELELSDFPATEFAVPCPRSGLRRDVNDVTIVNSNGIANDPSLKFYGFGGEINTPPTDGPSGQAEILMDIEERWPMANCNYRANTHFHVGVPGLSEDLDALKRLATYNAYWLPKVLEIVDPLPPKLVVGDLGWELTTQIKGYRRRRRRNAVSRHTVLPPNRLEKQLAARTVEEFHEAEVPRTKIGGKPMWHAQPRAAVNVRHLREGPSIEFRHFPGTTNPVQLATVGNCALPIFAVL